MSKSHVSRVRELYKLILRLHRSLPDDLKILGDNYAREEFKRHKKCKPQEAQIFLTEWRAYAVNMSRQVAPMRSERRPAGEQRAGPSRVRASIPRPEAGGGQPGAAGGHHRFGNNLDPQHIEQFNPDQLLNLYQLLIATWGENPHNEFEPIDIGIDLIDADINLESIEDAKTQILKMEETQSLRQDIILDKFDDPPAIKDNKELKLAINSLRVAEREAETAREVAKISLKECEKAKKLAEDAIAAAENVMKAKEVAHPNELKKLQDTVMEAQRKALIMAKQASEMSKRTVELVMEAKIKQDQSDSARNIAVDLRKTADESVRKSSNSSDPGNP